MKLKNFIIVGGSITAIASTTAIVVATSNSIAKKENGTKISDFENLIDVMGVPHDYNDSKYESRIAPFSDLGSWHGLSLPGYADRAQWGGFTQPLIVRKTAPRSISKSLDLLHLFEYKLDSSNNIMKRDDGSKIKKEISFRSLPKEKVHIKQYPGGLWQEFEINSSTTLQLDLRFTHQRTSTVKYKIINKSSSERSFELSWDGKLFQGAKDDEGAQFEDKATINSHPYKENIYGQAVMFDSTDNNPKILYYYTDANKNIVVTEDANNDFNFAHKGYIKGVPYHKVESEDMENNNDIRTAVNTAFSGYHFVNRNNSNKTANLNDSSNIIPNAVSIKFTKRKRRENWVGHKDDWRWQMVFQNNVDVLISSDKLGYKAVTKDPVVVSANSSKNTFVSTTFSFTSQEREGFKYEDHLDTEGDQIKGSYNDEVKLDMATPAPGSQPKIEKSFNASKERWDYYLNNLIGNDSKNNFTYQKVAVKGMESLITNWRGASGMLEHQGVTPSMSIQWFNSFWSWDSWKQATASVNFDPKLAMDNIKVLYDYQVVNDPKENLHYHFDPVRQKNDIGMIPDLVDYQQGNTNWRDTKPPLSAWSVWNIYKTTKERMWDKKDIRTGQDISTEVIDFLKYMYMRIMAYHAWWYQNRDGDGNGIVEYGGTIDQASQLPGWQRNDSEDEIVTAAAWESGMDNAPRFDKNGSGENDEGLKFTANRNADGTVSGWVLQQESVDLNSYMYAEKQYLINIAKALKNEGVSYNQLPGIKSDNLKKFLVNPMKDGLKNRLKGEAKKLKIMDYNELGISYEKDIIQMQKDAEFTKKYINRKMFDNNSGFYYDLRYQTDKSGKRVDGGDKLLTNRGKGPEGFIPLWANLADKDKAKKVRKNVMDPHGFNTFVPFPTASWDNDKFEPDQYWRGPVWLDQAYFGVRGLKSNNFNDNASYMVNKLFKNAEGLLNGGPIRENYNPITGKGLNAKGFSWSSGSYLLMYEHFIKGGR